MTAILSRLKASSQEDLSSSSEHLSDPGLSWLDQMKTLGDRLKHALAVRKKTAADLAKAVPTTESTVSQWLSGEIKSMRGGNLIAASAFLDISPQWLASGKGPSGLEESHKGAVIAAEPHASYPVTTQSAESADHTIPQYDAAGAMGHGLVLEARPPGVIREWKVNHEWLRLNVGHYTAVENLAIVTGFGSSMRGMFNPGDPLLCDCGVKQVDIDGVYFFRVDNHGFIKILQRIPTDAGVILRAKSKNPDYEPFDITAKIAASDGFEVFGRILTVWKSEQL
jgi:phage repressor protein C with HTH and peptisase S24 domain